MRVALIGCLVMVLTSAVRADHVRVSAVASSTAISPGKPVTIAVKFQIDPGWHIYWTNPGDSGVATRLKLTLPTGVTATPVRFPAPKRIVLPGDITNYGYSDDAVLLFDVTSTTAGAVDLQIDASWLVCQETCIPGKTAIKLSISAGAPVANESENFAAWNSKLPATVDSEAIASIAVVDEMVSKQDVRHRVEIKWKMSPSNIVFAPAFDRAGFADDAKTSDGVTTVELHGNLPAAGQPIGIVFFKAADGSERTVMIPSPDEGPRQVATKK